MSICLYRLFHFVVPRFVEPSWYPVSEPTFVIWRPFFQFRSFWNTSLAAQSTTCNNCLCFPFPLAASGMTSSCHSDRVLLPPLSSSQARRLLTHGRASSTQRNVLYVYMGEHIAVEVTGNIWKPFTMCESLPILVNIRAGATTWPWSSEPVAAAGRCRC